MATGEKLCNGYGKNHTNADGTYFNPWSTEAKNLGFNFKSTSFKLVKFLAMRRVIDDKVPDLSQESLDKHFPVIPFDGESEENSRAPDEGMRCTWFGHATCLVQFDNISVLTDPVFSDRCAPVQLPGLPKRLRKVPCNVEKLPKIDIVVISHNHYDHLDLNTVKDLNKCQGSGVNWFVGLGLKKWFTDLGVENVHELDWWDEHKLRDDVTVVFTPTQHWSKRTPFDTNKSLWGSWIVKGPRFKFMHLGDTGYCQTFKTIGDVHGPIDLAAVPIGAYHPRDFLKAQHVDPVEAVQIHQDIKAKKSVGIHWGTFELGREAFLGPRRELEAELQKKNLSDKDFFTTVIGESVHLFL